MSARSRSLKLPFGVLLTVSVTAAIVAACGESVTQVGSGDIAAIRVTPDSAFVGVDRTFTMEALALDATGSFLVGQEVTWTTGSADIVTVDASGVLTGVAAGETEVTATAAGLSA